MTMKNLRSGDRRTGLAAVIHAARGSGAPAPRRAQAPCPFIDFDPATGENFYNDSALCQNIYAFLLTPKHQKR
jgi:hypothetical protein